MFDIERGSDGIIDIPGQTDNKTVLNIKTALLCKDNSQSIGNTLLVWLNRIAEGTSVPLAVHAAKQPEIPEAFNLTG